MLEERILFEGTFIALMPLSYARDLHAIEGVKLNYYKDDGKELINETKPKEISLENALEEIGGFPTTEGNFIGFINEEGETIQFHKNEEDAWVLDVPVVENGYFIYSLKDDDLTTEKVKIIVKKFFLGENWQYLCRLTK